MNSEMDAYGVRGFIGTACALPIGIARLTKVSRCSTFAQRIARLPKRSLRLRFALRACPDLVRVKASRVAFHFVPRRGSRTHDFVVISRSRIIQIKRKPPRRVVFLFIGIARFELTTSCSRSKRSTRLSYIPVLWAQL